MKRLEEMTLEELRAYVRAHCLVLADGVLASDGMRVWRAPFIGTEPVRSAMVKDVRARITSLDGWTYEYSAGSCYSTREAAEAAARIERDG